MSVVDDFGTFGTAADGAELAVLLHDLTGRHSEHRKNCAACQGNCTILAAYLEHREECGHCQNSVKVATETYGDPCPRYLAFVAHGDSCERCNPCRAVQKAVEALVDWRAARLLRSKATWLRRLEIEREIALENGCGMNTGDKLAATRTRGNGWTRSY